MTLKEAIKKYGKARRTCWKSSPVLKNSYVTIDTYDDFIDETGTYAIFNLTFFDDDWEEYREPILTSEEEEYLEAVIKPFRDRVHYICKIDVGDGYQYIRIKAKRYDYKDFGDECYQYEDEDINFPYFKGDTMYVNMKDDRNYTLEELGL